MAGAKNKVIAGDYLGHVVGATAGQVMFIKGFGVSVALNKTTVEGYEVITDDIRKSAASGVARGIVGGLLLGPVGMLAGSLSAKNKGIHTIAIAFRDEKKSLVEVDVKVYQALVKACF